MLMCRQILNVIIASALIGGCSSSENTGDTDKNCVPGQSTQCGCTDGSLGAQLCNLSGTALEPCVCKAAGDTSDSDVFGGDSDMVVSDTAVSDRAVSDTVVSDTVVSDTTEPDATESDTQEEVDTTGSNKEKLLIEQNWATNPLLVYDLEDDTLAGNNSKLANLLNTLADTVEQSGKWVTDDSWVPTFFNNPNITTKEVADNLHAAAAQPAAVWLDTSTTILNQAELDAACVAGGKLEGQCDTNPSTGMYEPDGNWVYRSLNSNSIVDTLIVYNMPERDCAANASAGEYMRTNTPGCDNTPNDGATCAQNLLTKYKSEYIDKIAVALDEYSEKGKKAILVIEVDSLPNLVTNLDAFERCAWVNQHNIYVSGVEYALEQLCKGREPYVACYLDAGHGAWLGWENNLTEFIALLKNLKGFNNVRGFASNVANYSPVGEVCQPVLDGSNLPVDVSKCSNHTDPAQLISQYNPGYNEVMYGEMLCTLAEQQGLLNNCRYIIDTSRNGNAGTRTNATAVAQWCNVGGIGPDNYTGMGHEPASIAALQQEFAKTPPHLDGFAWLKTPSETDGQTYTPSMDKADTSHFAPTTSCWYNPEYSDPSDLFNNPTNTKTTDSHCAQASYLPGTTVFGVTDASGNLLTPNAVLHDCVPVAGSFFAPSAVIFAANARFKGADNSTNGASLYIE